MRTKGNSAVHLMDAVDNDGKTFLKNVASSSKIPSAFEIDSVDDEVEYSLAKMMLSRSCHFALPLWLSFRVQTVFS